MCENGFCVSRMTCDAAPAQKESPETVKSISAITDSKSKEVFCARLRELCIQQKINTENTNKIIDAAKKISSPYKKNFITHVNPKISHAGAGNAQNAAHAAALMRAVKKEIYPLLA